MQATDDMVQRIVDEIDFTDGSNAYAEIRRALDPILNSVVTNALHEVRSAVVDNSGWFAGEQVDHVASTLGVEL
jgi:hypothetical protein